MLSLFLDSVTFCHIPSDKTNKECCFFSAACLLRDRSNEQTHMLRSLFSIRCLSWYNLGLNLQPQAYRTAALTTVLLQPWWNQSKIKWFNTEAGCATEQRCQKPLVQFSVMPMVPDKHQDLIWLCSLGTHTNGLNPLIKHKLKPCWCLNQLLILNSPLWHHQGQEKRKMSNLNFFNDGPKSAMLWHSLCIQHETFHLYILNNSHLKKSP